MRKTKLFYNAIIILTLILMSLGNPSMVAQAGKDKSESRVDPRLLQMAKENPLATFMVIVQKEADKKDLIDEDPLTDVKKGGGKVKKHLKLIESFSAEISGKEIIKLAKNKKVRWISADAPMVSTAAGGMDSIRDEFTSNTYDGNNGSGTWTADWIEGNQDGDYPVSTVDTGSNQVVQSGNCAGGIGYCLEVEAAEIGEYIYREADLSGFVSVWLSFYRNNLLDSSRGKSEQVQLQVSSDGGASWTTLQTYSSNKHVGAATDSFDISAYASSNTRIRLLVDGKEQKDDDRYIYFDDIAIAFARPSAFLSTVRADQLMSLNGQDVTVAVVDSGISPKNNDFDSAGNNSRIIKGEFFGDHVSVSDLYGHGTHVAGIIGGNGANSNGKYRGVAPGVNLVNLRVSDKDGKSYESNVLAGLQWIYDNKDLYNIRVVNLSVNSTVDQSYHTSPLDAAVEILWFNGIVVVVSAGNNGTADGPSTLYPPANDPFVITVGATEDKGTGDLVDDNLAAFSAYGPTFDGFAKPDLVAPGRNVVAPLSEKASSIYIDHPLHRVDDNYVRMSGTSMSAPVVTGAVALLLQDEPQLNPDQVKYRLMSTANQNWPGYNASGSGAGCLDIYSAVESTTTESANTGILISQMLSTANGDPVTMNSVGWNSVGWNSVGWNSVGWNSVGWNSVGWNSVGWNSVGWNSVGWNSSTWDD